MSLHRHHDEFIRITKLNAGDHQRGICGFAAAYCFLLVTQPSFVTTIGADHNIYKDNDKYQSGLKRLKSIFPFEERFNHFIATNVMRWILDNGPQISELREFAISWPDIHHEAVYNKDLPLDKAIFDMLVRVGIPLTPGNMLDMLAHYSVEPRQDLKLVQVPSIYEYFEQVGERAIEWESYAGVMGLSKGFGNTLMHHGLLHWVFFVEGSIYTWGHMIRSREDSIVNMLSDCSHVSYIYGLPDPGN